MLFLRSNFKKVLHRNQENYRTLSLGITADYLISVAASRDSMHNKRKQKKEYVLSNYSLWDMLWYRSSQFFNLKCFAVYSMKSNVKIIKCIFSSEFLTLALPVIDTVSCRISVHGWELIRGTCEKPVLLLGDEKRSVQDNLLPSDLSSHPEVPRYFFM